jgi:ADP-ribose pyrophosphatase YjhB (NUDIX family)
VKEWLVASGIVEGPGSLLLVQNRRRDGRTDWSPPGGVIETEDGESVRDGLTREVVEETGIAVTEWDGPVWSVEAEAQAAGWRLRVEVYRAIAYEGAIEVNDPDGIVIDARFVPVDDCALHLASTWLPTHEPLVAWLAERWTSADTRAFRYRIEGASRDQFNIVRL